MNIKELEILKELSEQTYFGDLPFLYYADLIGKLLTDYKQKCNYIKENEIYKKNLFNSYEEKSKELEKEKEKNKKLEKFIKNGEYTWKQKYNETFKYFKEELEKEKEKNKSLLQCLKDSQERCENEHLFLGNPDM